MPRGFGTPPKPWQCRIYQGQRIFASLKIAAQDGDPITRKNATKTAILITSLLQEPTKQAVSVGWPIAWGMTRHRH